MNGKNVIKGKDGWLFLDEGSNFSISQITGKLQIQPTELNRWARILKFRNEWFGDRYRTVVCPEKACVYPDLLPDQFTVEANRTIAKIRNSTTGLIYPCDDLKKDDAHLKVYPKTDTHFSELGSSIVAKLILESLGLEPVAVFDQLVYTERMVVGDLGLKFDTHIKNLNYFCSNFPDIRVDDNGLRNRGRISRYVNPNLSGSKLLLYGDSFSGINLAKMLSLQFATVYFVHSGSIDYGLVDRLNPDYVICEYAERFMSTAPVESTSIASVILEKRIMNTYSDEMLVDFLNNTDSFSYFFGDDELKTLIKYCQSASVDNAKSKTVLRKVA